MRILYIQVAITTKGKAAHYDKKRVRKKTCERGKGHQNQEEGRKAMRRMPF
jgi:hypothetical protein